MRKMAKNRQNFTVKKKHNFFILDSIWLKFKLDLNIIKTTFLLIFSILGLKKQKLRFFNKIRVFL